MTAVDALGRAFSIPRPHSRYSRDSRRASRSREFSRAPAWPSELRSRAILPEFLAESHRGGVFPYPVSRSRRCRYRPKSAGREKSAGTRRGICLLRPGRPARPKSSGPRTGPVLRVMAANSRIAKFAGFRPCPWRVRSGIGSDMPTSRGSGHSYVYGESLRRHILILRVRYLHRFIKEGDRVVIQELAKLA